MSSHSTEGTWAIATHEPTGVRVVVRHASEERARKNARTILASKILGGKPCRRTIRTYDTIQGRAVDESGAELELAEPLFWTDLAPIIHARMEAKHGKIDHNNSG